MLPEKILQLFSFLSKLEQSVQIRKKVLNSYNEFDPAKIFKKLDTENKGHITPDNISSFLNEHNILYTEESLKLLIIFYDTDFDGVLSFEEFIPLIQKDNILLINKKKNVNSNNDEISFNIEYCLKKIFEKELQLNQYIVIILSQINKIINENLLNVFTDISLNKNYITQKDIMNYLDKNRIDYTENQINDIMKRLDINKDGKIEFNEFDYLFGLTKSKKYNNKNSNIESSFNKYNISYGVRLNNFNEKEIDEHYNNGNEKYNEINNNDYQNCLINEYDLEINGINQNNICVDNEEYQNSVVNQNNKINCYCIHNINAPCCECNYIQNLINDNIIENKNNNNYENEENKDLFSNDRRNGNKKNYGNNNNLFYRKNFKYEDIQNVINNNSINNKNKNKNIVHNINYAHSNCFEKDYPKKSFFLTKNGNISKNLSLRKSPIRKIPLLNKKNPKNINYNSNNNNDTSYYYEEKNDNPLIHINKEINKTKYYNNFNDTYSFFNNSMSYNNLPPLRRNQSQGNFIINKNNTLNNNSKKKLSNISNANNICTNKEENFLRNYFKLIMEGERQINLTKKNLVSRNDFNCTQIFNFFDEQNKGYITFDELKNELEFIGLILNEKEIQLLINRFGTNKKRNVIEYIDFYNGIYDNILENKKISNDNYENININIFSPTTRLYFKVLIKSIADFENKLYTFKKENLNKNSKNHIKILLNDIDFEEKGFLNINDLNHFLKEKEIYSSLKDSQLLFSRFDKNKKGIILKEDILSDLKCV